MDSREEILDCLAKREVTFSRSLKNNLSHETLDSIYEVFKQYEKGKIQEHSMDLFKFGLTVIGVDVGESQEQLRDKLNLHC